MLLSLNLKQNEAQRAHAESTHKGACQVRVAVGNSGLCCSVLCDVFWALINSCVCQFWRVLSHGQRNGACSSMPQSATESWAWHDSQPHPSSSPTPETTPSSRRYQPNPTKEFTSLWQPSTDPPHQHHHRESKPHPGIPSSEPQALPKRLQTCGMPVWHSSTHSRSTEPSFGDPTSSKTLTSYNKSSRLQHTSQPGTIGPKHLGSCRVSSTSMISQLSMSGVNNCVSPSRTRQSRGSCQ